MWVGPSNSLQWVESGCPFQDFVSKDPGFCLVWPLQLSGKLALRDVISCLMEKGSLWPSVREELRPSVQQPVRTRILPATSWVRLEADPPAEPWVVSSPGCSPRSRGPGRKAQLSHTQMPAPQKLWDNERVLRPALSAGIIYYTCMDN